MQNLRLPDSLDNRHSSARFENPENFLQCRVNIIDELKHLFRYNVVKALVRYLKLRNVSVLERYLWQVATPVPRCCQHIFVHIQSDHIPLYSNLISNNCCFAPGPTSN